MQRGEDLYHLDEGALAGLDADLVVTQDLCAVCAVDVSVVDDALAHLGCTAEVLTIDPHTLAEVLESIRVLGQATGREGEADALVQDTHRRLADVVRRVGTRPRPRVVLLEWTDPPFAPGHWIPEMVDLAGGDPVLGTAGEKCVRITWEDVHAARPDVVVVAPCGFDRAGSQALADELVASGVLPDGVPVQAVDANASWARPGTRLVDGIEELAGCSRRSSGPRDRLHHDGVVALRHRLAVARAEEVALLLGCAAPRWSCTGRWPAPRRRPRRRTRRAPSAPRRRR